MKCYREGELGKVFTLVQKGIQKPGRLGNGQYGAAPGTLPQELRALKQGKAGGNHRGEKISFLF